MLGTNSKLKIPNSKTPSFWFGQRLPGRFHQMWRLPLIQTLLTDFGKIQNLAKKLFLSEAIWLKVYKEMLEMTSLVTTRLIGGALKILKDQNLPGLDTREFLMICRR